MSVPLSQLERQQALYQTSAAICLGWREGMMLRARKAAWGLQMSSTRDELPREGTMSATKRLLKSRTQLSKLRWPECSTLTRTAKNFLPQEWRPSTHNKIGAMALTLQAVPCHHVANLPETLEGVRNRMVGSCSKNLSTVSQRAA